MSECEHHDYTMVEDYIRGLQWSPAATDHEKSLVSGNIRGFYEHMRKAALPVAAGAGVELATEPADISRRIHESDAFTVDAARAAFTGIESVRAQVNPRNTNPATTAGKGE